MLKSKIKIPSPNNFCCIIIQPSLWKFFRENEINIQKIKVRGIRYQEIQNENYLKKKILL